MSDPICVSGITLPKQPQSSVAVALPVTMTCILAIKKLIITAILKRAANLMKTPVISKQPSNSSTQGNRTPYTFDNPKEVSEVDVYWFDDTYNRDRDFPLGWQVLYKENGEWVPVRTMDTFGIERDMYNRVRFEPVKTDAVRLEISMPPVSGGIIDWQVR